MARQSVGGLRVGMATASEQLLTGPMQTRYVLHGCRQVESHQNPFLFLMTRSWISMRDRSALVQSQVAVRNLRISLTQQNSRDKLEPPVFRCQGLQKQIATPKVVTAPGTSSQGFLQGEAAPVTPPSFSGGVAMPRTPPFQDFQGGDTAPMMPIVESPKNLPSQLPCHRSHLLCRFGRKIHPRHWRILTNLQLTVKPTMSFNLVIPPVTTPLIQLPRHHHVMIN